MAVASTTITTAGTTLSKLWRKVQGNMLTGFKSRTEEYSWIKDGTKRFEVDISAREITSPIDIVRQGGAAFYPEDGYEARPGTNAPQEITLTWSNLTQSFTVSQVAKALDMRSRAVQIQRQLKYQAIKSMESVSRRIGQTFYGYSTGVVCKTSTAATQSSGTYTLLSAYGEASLGSAAYLARFFCVGDWVALIRSSALVSNAIGQVTAVSESGGTIDITWNGSVASNSGDSIVFANSRENTSISGTDWNLWPTGLLDVLKSTSLHSLNGSTYGNWTASTADTSGGRMTSVRARKMRQAAKNRSDIAPDMIILSQGVENDMFDGMQGMRRANESIIDFDGDIKTKEKRYTSERVLPGYFIMGNSGAFRTFTLQDAYPDEDPGAPSYADGDKLENLKAFQFSVDISYAYVCTCRGAFGYASGITEQAP